MLRGWSERVMGTCTDTKEDNEPGVRELNSDPSRWLRQEYDRPD